MNIKEFKKKYHIAKIHKGWVSLRTEIACNNRVYKFTDKGPKRLLSHMHEELVGNLLRYPENYAVFCVDEITLYGSFSYWSLCHHPEEFEYILNDDQEDWALRIRARFGIQNISKWDSVWTGDPRTEYTIYSLDTGSEVYRGTYGGVPLQPRTLIVYDTFQGTVWCSVDPEKNFPYDELYKLIFNFFDLREKQNANTRLEGQVQT